MGTQVLSKERKLRGEKGQKGERESGKERKARSGQTSSQNGSTIKEDCNATPAEPENWRDGEKGQEKNKLRGPDTVDCNVKLPGSGPPET